MHHMHVSEILMATIYSRFQGITCICDEAAEELMWGLQNLMHVLVPEEKSEFEKQDRKFHSQKLLAYLRQNVRGRDIKPKMVSH